MATLRKGSTGQDVRELQTALNGKGYTLSVDGIYGDKTAAAVRDYQQKNGLSMVDGIAGNETWGSLRAATQSSTRRRQQITSSTVMTQAGTKRIRTRSSGCRRWRDEALLRRDV